MQDFSRIKMLAAVLMSTTCIRVWDFYDAPQEFQELSKHGGDEDWIALIPPNLANEYIGWMEEGSSFGCCSVSTHVHSDFPGWLIKIGAHA